MFVKLMKHEILASYRKFLPIYAAIMILSIITPLTRDFSSTAIFSSIMSITMLMMGAVFFFTLYTLIINLGQRVFGKPGYLLFTTPATTLEIIAAKTIINMLWLMLSAVVGAFAIFSFMFVVLDGQVWEIFESLFRIIGENPFETVTILVAGITYCFYVIGILFFLFALLNMVYKGEKKILFGILLYFVISQGVGMIAGIFIGAYVTVVETIFASIVDLWFFIGVYGVIGLALYVLTYLIIEKKLEIQ
ncbi:MAG: hypothetical protein CVV63_01790 [Tenericutes bacterium HGW-Tenericutes-8]|nr:MAG: hypothetical protein CVV63_01790 [Tenericutes bacterium HGW-Tenericutes-8]